MKNIILTGSSSGFGLLTAQKLAGQGHHVFATMRNINTSNIHNAANIKEWAAANNLQIAVVELDVTSDASVKRAVEEIAAATGGKIDVLINNAGSAFIGINETLSAEQTNQMFQINVIGVDRMIKAVLPYMHKQKSGLLVTLSSIVSRQPIPVMGIYGASKAAVDALTVSYHYELKPLGIDAVNLQPGAYPSTDIVSKQPVPANPDAEANYSDGIIAYKNGLLKYFEPNESSPNSTEVADAIAKLVNTPAGERSLWTIVGGGPLQPYFEQINQTSKTIVDTILSRGGH